MMLSGILLKNKALVLDAWLEEALAAYPADNTRFLKNQKDPFANPVGRALHEGLSGLLDQLAGLSSPETALLHVDKIVRVAAVQDFSPSRAVGFVFALKGIVRDLSAKQAACQDMARQVRDFDARVDALALAAFDAYQKCRDRIHEIRLCEVKNLSYKAMKRANLVCDIEDPPGEESLY